MNRPRILIVEDEVVVAMDLRQQLLALGYEPVAETRMGEEAILLAGQLQPDLVLMDINLAGEMDGIAAAEAIHDRFSIPVVFLTAFTSDSFVSRAKLVAPLGFICKPFQKRELRIVIEMALFKRQAEIRQGEIHEEQVAILRTALDGYWMVDMQGRILDVNDAGCRMHGYTREEMLRMAIADFETDESPAGIVEQIQRIMRAGSSRSERTHRCKDGSHINLDISSNYRPTSGGRLIAFLRDITERKQKEAVLAQLNAQLQTKNRELEQVVHVISHDLRSPLVNIDGYGRELGGAVETLARALEAGATTIEALTEAVRPIVQGMSIDLQYIRSSAAHMDVLLTGLMKLSRYGRSGLTIAPLNMNELVAKVVATTTFQLDQNAVELEVAELPPCQGDAVQVVQVFTNLLGNALKYLDPGRRGVIRIRGGIESQHVVYCVEDNGVGIAPAHQEKIFEIFHRLDPFKSQGEGLGLTIVRQAVGRLAGDAWVESKPGEGSRFYVRLPAAQG